MKKILLLLSMLFILLPIYSISDSNDTSVLKVNAVVPEDYGISFPRDSYHMDRIYLEVDSSLVSSSGLTATFEDGSLDMTLLYYGNQSDDYSFTFSFPDEIWWLSNSTALVPIDVKIEDAILDDDITVVSTGNRSVFVTIPATGPRRGEQVVKVTFSWTLSPDLSPAILELPLDMHMGVNI